MECAFVLHHMMLPAEERCALSMVALEQELGYIVFLCHCRHAGARTRSVLTTLSYENAALQHSARTQCPCFLFLSREEYHEGCNCPVPQGAQHILRVCHHHGIVRYVEALLLGLTEP